LGAGVERGVELLTLPAHAPDPSAAAVATAIAAAILFSMIVAIV